MKKTEKQIALRSFDKTDENNRNPSELMALRRLASAQLHRVEGLGHLENASGGGGDELHGADIALRPLLRRLPRILVPADPHTCRRISQAWIPPDRSWSCFLPR